MGRALTDLEPTWAETELERVMNEQILRVAQAAGVDPSRVTIAIATPQAPAGPDRTAAVPRFQ